MVRAGGGRTDPASFLAAVDTLADLVDSEAAAAGVTTERCVVGGFSQGGFLALALAARVGAPRFAGVWAMCCAMPEIDGLQLDPSSGAGTPALCRSASATRSSPPTGVGPPPHSWPPPAGSSTERGYDMAHSQRIEMMIDARDWLAAIS